MGTTALATEYNFIIPGWVVISHILRALLWNVFVGPISRHYFVAIANQSCGRNNVGLPLLDPVNKIDWKPERLD